MSIQDELIARIATFGHADWIPAFGRELYTDVLYIDVPDSIGGVPARYYVASVDETRNLLDADLQARIEMSIGIVTPEPSREDEHATDPALPTIEAQEEETSHGR